MKLSKNNSFILLHFIIIIWGFTAILGEEINMSSEHIVWNRMMIACIILFLINLLFKKSEKIRKTDTDQYMLIGLCIVIHWVCFFESIKLSTISLATICLSSVSLFTSILEPVIQKRKIKAYEILLSLLIIVGIFIISRYEAGYYQAIFLSIISAFFAALFTVLNHKLIKTGHKAMTITAWEMFFGVVLLSVYLLVNNELNSDIIPSGSDLIYILILGLICTAFAFAASIEIMKKISPFTVNLSVNLEPIYAIILALVIYGEKEVMTKQFYIGSLLIISSIIVNTIIKHIESKKAKK